MTIVITFLAAFWALVIGYIAYERSNSAALGRKIETAVKSAAIFAGMLAVLVALQWLLSSSPPCFDEQCDQLRELRQGGP